MTIYKIKGPMFFASADKWSDIKPLNDSDIITLDLSVVTFLDASATKSLFAILKRCKENGLKLMLAGVNEQPLKAMKKAKFTEAIGEENIWPEIEKLPEELHFR